jgi:phosphopantetheinyl transferase
MTDHEMDVMDELHFVQSFAYLLANTGLAETELRITLWQAAKKGWVKIMRTVDEEVEMQTVDFENQCHAFFYLATKKGLLAYHTGE